PDLSFEQKVEILQTLDVERRLELAIAWANRTLADLELKEKIGREVAEGMDKRQREFLLREQLEAIRKELGEADDGPSIAEEFRAKIAASGMPEQARQEAERELARLQRTSPQSPEYGWIRTYLDWMTEVPWNRRTEDNLNVAEARRILTEDHTGLEDVKERIIEYLSVRRLRKERGLAETETATKRGSGAILTLIGPPGVGKTSLGESVARALGRKFGRISLGGMEVIRIDGYTEDEKVDIARDHLGPRQFGRNGLRPEEVALPDKTIRQIVANYTREAGVRNLEREIGKVLRKVATRIAAGEAAAPVTVNPDALLAYLGRPKFYVEAAERTSVPGVATGLAVTGAGGDVLFVEAA